MLNRACTFRVLVFTSPAPVDFAAPVAILSFLLLWNKRSTAGIKRAVTSTRTCNHMLFDWIHHLSFPMSQSGVPQTSIDLLPSGILEMVARICNSRSAALSLSPLGWDSPCQRSRTSVIGDQAIQRSANRQPIPYLADAATSLSYLYYALTQLLVEVSSGIIDDDDNQRHLRSPIIRRR